MKQLLQDKIFISTRPKNSSDELFSLFSQAGATLIEWPLIQIQDIELSEKEKKYFTRLTDFQWILFTSSNGVKYFFIRLKEITGFEKIPEQVQLAAIGKKTKSTLESFGCTPSFVNPGSTAESFAESFMHHIKKGTSKPKILLPLGNLARTVIEKHLKETADCFRMEIYKTEVPDGFDETIVKQIKEDRYDMIIFTSPSGIINFTKIAGAPQRKNIRMACIGPTTALAASEHGFNPLVVAQNSSATGIFESILNYYI